MTSKVLGIIALKGGVGKTTVTANLGSVLAKELQKNVLVVDGNFSTPHLALSLGLADPEITLHHVLNGKASIFDALHRHSSGFYLVPGSSFPEKVNPMSLKNKLSEIVDYYDFILIDSSPSLNDEILATMMASDGLLVVTSPDYPTLASTIHAVRIARQKNTPILGLIINKSRDKKFELSIDDIERATGVPVISVLPDDDRVLEALSESTTAVLHSPNRKISKEYLDLGEMIANEKYVSFSKRDKKKFERLLHSIKRNFTELKKKIKFKGRDKKNAKKKNK